MTRLLFQRLRRPTIRRRSSTSQGRASTDPLERLQLAYTAFEAGRFAEVEATLETGVDDSDLAGAALSAAARALQLEAEGRAGESIALMEHAFHLDVAFPSLLREIGLFFERNDRPELAHHAMLALDVLDPDELPPRPTQLRGGGLTRHGPRYIRQRLAKGRQLTYGVAPLKYALVERLGAAGAAMVLAGIADGEAPRIASRKRLLPLIEHARATGQDYAEAIPAESVLSYPPAVFGRPRSTPFEKRTRVLFTCALEDIVVPSRSNVLLAPEAALLDVQGDELARDPVLEVDPLIVAREGDHVYVTQARDRDGLERLPEAIWLTGVHASGFGHWLMEFLPKLWALIERPGSGAVPILIDDGMPVQHAEALRLFADPSQPIVTLRPHQHVRVDRLWVASQIVYLPAGPRPGATRSAGGRALHPDGFRRLIARAHRALGSVDGTGMPGRIYLTRKPSQARRLVNAPAIEELLARHGFHAIDFGELPFIDQLRHIVGAEHVVGQDGSALLMTMLGRRGLRIGGLAQPQLEEWEWYADASEALGQELTVVLGSLAKAHPDYEWKSDYEIDLDVLEAYLARTV